MMAWLFGYYGRIAGGIATFLVAIAFFVWRLIQLGKRSERVKQLEVSAKKQKEMQDASASVDRSADGLVDRLRKGDF